MLTKLRRQDCLTKAMFARLDSDALNKVRYLYSLVPPHARLNDLGIKGKKAYYRFIKEACNKVGKGMLGLESNFSNLDELVDAAGWDPDWMDERHYMTDKEKKDKDHRGKGICTVSVPQINRFGTLRKKRCPPSSTFVYELYTSNGTWLEIGAPNED